jgi:ATP-binding cassette subfamily B protein
LGISDAAEKIGFRTLGAKLKIVNLKEAELPSILHWRQNHFVVLHKISKGKYHIADPGQGLVKLSEQEFAGNWLSDGQNKEGIALLLSSTPYFYEQEEEKATDIKWGFLLRYLITYQQLVIQLLFGLSIGTLLQLVTPFLTQSVVDIGINTRNINFIYIVIIAQAALIVGRVSVDFIRSWILLHISTRINISILTDF